MELCNVTDLHVKNMVIRVNMVNRYHQYMADRPAWEAGINYEKARAYLYHQYMDLTAQHGKPGMSYEKMTVQKVMILVNHRKVQPLLEDQMNKHGKQGRPRSGSTTRMKSTTAPC